MQSIQKETTHKEHMLHLARNPLSVQFLFVKCANSIYSIEKKKITHLQAQGNYTTIFTSEKKILCSKTLKHFAALLESRLFIRVHQSFLVNVSHVDQFHYDGRSQIVLDSGISIPVSRRKKSFLIDTFQN